AQACKELNIECPHKRVEVTDAEVKEFIDSQNEHRRHLTVEQLKARRVGRVQRVGQARAEGQSTRAIAAQEGVSQSQVVRDLAENQSENSSVEPPGSPDASPAEQNGSDPIKISPSVNGDAAIVSGKDGKSYKPKK